MKKKKKKKKNKKKPNDAGDDPICILECKLDQQLLNGKSLAKTDEPLDEEAVRLKL